MDLGIRIKELRKNKRMSQEELASVLNISTAAVCKWESGLSCPDLSNLVLIAQLFNVSVDYLLGCNLIFENEERLCQELNQLTKERSFRYLVDDVLVLEKKYPNSVKLSCFLAVYLFTMSYEENNLIARKEALRIALKVYDANDRYLSSVKNRNELERIIIESYLSLGFPEKAIDFMKEYDIMHTNLDFGNAYMKLDKNSIALEYFSKSLNDGLTDVTNTVAAEGLVLYRLGKVSEAIELIDWGINLITPLIIDPNATLNGVKVVLLSLKAGILYPQDTYLNVLDEALKIALEYKKNNKTNEGVVKFIYSESDELTTFTDDLFYEIKKIAHMVITDNFEGFVDALDNKKESLKKHE